MQKVLIIDDSALMRRKACDIINADKDFQVSEMSMNIDDAYKRIKENSCDAVVIGMSARVDTVLFMQRLKSLKKKPNVVILTTSFSEDIEKAKESISLGAYTYVIRENRMNGMTDAVATSLMTALKNAASGKPATSSNAQIQETAKRVEALGRQVTSSLENIAAKKVENQPIAQQKNDKPLRIKEDTVVALACSTGGPQALQIMIPMLPADLPVPIVLVQHMPAGFTASLANRLNQTSAVSVKEAAEGDVLEAGCVYIAPGGKHMEIVKNKSGKRQVHISDEPPVNSLKPCADIMYDSLCHMDYKEILCVVLTGMGADGTKGITSLKKHKKIYVISESQDTCVVYGMPRSVERAGLSDKVVPINQIADAIVKKLGD